MKEKIWMRKGAERVTAIFFALLLAIMAMPVAAFGQEVNTLKEEVVYINLHGDGSLKEIYVVNSFELEKGGQVIDYGEYEELRNMTTMDKISCENGKITINTGAKKLYYEGKLTKAKMPWRISIHYYLDGKEYSAEEIAGKSGKLRLTMSVQQNPQAEESFFQGYALQATFLLNTDNCKNIEAEGATIANVGKNKQVTYTILPGREAEMVITSRVENFEMEEIAINGIRLSMDMEVDETEYQDKLNEITDAVKDLDEGAGSLKEGSSQLQTGAGEISEGADSLSQGINSLYEGAESLYSAMGILKEKVQELHSGVGSLAGGASDLSSGLSTLAGKNGELTSAAWSAYEALCSAAQTQVNQVLTANGLAEVTLTPENYASVLAGISAQIDAEAVYQQAYNEALQEVTAQVEAQADQLYAAYVQSLQAAGQAITIDDLTEEQKEEIRNNAIQQMMASDEVQQKINAAVESVNAAAASLSTLKAQLDSYGSFYKGLVAYTAGVSDAASGAASLQADVNTLYTNTDLLRISVEELYAAVGKLSEGTTELSTGARELNEGARALNEGAGELNTGAKELSDGTGKFADELSGLDGKIEEEIDSLLSSVKGEEVEIVSFVSEKNTQIKAVQFIIKTDAIQVEEAEAVVEEVQESLSFWEKLVQLFKGWSKERLSTEKCGIYKITT